MSKDIWMGSRENARRRLNVRRGGLFPCLLAGLLLVFLVLLLAVFLTASQEALFERLLVDHLNFQSLQTDEASVRSFARETVLYITHRQSVWEPQITINGFPAGSFIPPSFRGHMAEVRDWLGLGKLVFSLGFGFAALLLGGSILVGGLRGRRGFSLGGYYLGVGLAVLAIAILALWGALHFESLWQILHEVLIPNGIFSASEPVMKLFPLEVFAGYLPPVLMTFGLLLLAVLALPLLLSPFARAVTQNAYR